MARKKVELKKILTKKNALLTIALIAWVGAVNYFLPRLLAYPMIWFFDKSFLVSPVGETLFTAIGYTICALTIIFVPKLIKKGWGTTREKLGLSELPTFTDIGLSVLGFIASILIAGIVTSIISALIPGFNASETQDIGYSTQIYGFDRAVAFIALVVIAPIAEEIIFRGWLYDKLKKYIPVAPAIILVSALFGFLHLQWNVGITVGIMSVIMCIERELTGTIYAGILTHMLKNGIAFWMLFVLV